jgi:hypothetical protein
MDGWYIKKWIDKLNGRFGVGIMHADVYLQNKCCLDIDIDGYTRDWPSSYKWTIECLVDD